MQSNPRLIFFGTSEFSVIVLEKLMSAGYSPVLVVTMPDKPAGKHLELTPSPIKIFAQKNNLELFQPENLKAQETLEYIKRSRPDIGVVVAYGKIIPESLIKIFPHGLLNIHASLLPKLRGASPIETAILEDEKRTGVSVMLVDSEMDHGPIIAAKEVVVLPWPPTYQTLGKALVDAGAELLIGVLPKWLNGSIEPQEQDQAKATYTKKIQKADGLIDLQADPYKNFLKIQAFSDWPGTYFFVIQKTNSGEMKKTRVIIKKAHYTDGKLMIETVVPEGKKEMKYSDFLSSLQK